MTCTAERSAGNESVGENELSRFSAEISVELVQLLSSVGCIQLLNSVGESFVKRRN